MRHPLALRAGLALALLCGVLALSLPFDGRLAAAAAPRADAPATTWAVIGDYGSGDANAAAVANLVKSWNPAYVVSTGDGYRAEAGGSGSAKFDNSTGAFYCRFLGGITTAGAKCPTPGGSTNNRFFPALGNHEYLEAGVTNNLPTNYTDYFALPGPGVVSDGHSGNERYYDFVQGPVHFFVINSNNGAGQEPDGTGRASVQAAWLKDRLAASRSPWKIVIFHHPPYSSGSHGSNAWMQWPFAQWGADVVISGHDHDYERILRDGIVYFVNGTGGATESTYNCQAPVDGSQICLDKVFGAQRVTATATRLKFDFINAQGELCDTYTVTKPSAAAAARGRASAKPAAAGQESAGQQTRINLPLVVNTAPPVAPGCSLMGQAAAVPFCWEVLGSGDEGRWPALYSAGVRYKVFAVHWREFAPVEGQIDANYVNRKLGELARLRQAGFKVILSTGIHDAPAWVHTFYPNSYYVNQYGEAYRGTAMDSGDVNFVFNPMMRRLAEIYLRDMFARFGADFAAVRMGGGRYDELTYPPHVLNGHSNLYWSFDGEALARDPAPAWRPGNPSPNGEAQKYLRWYLDSLTGWEHWQISTLRQNYAGPLMILFPSWGIRAGDFEAAVATNLNGTSSAERNGEIPRGYDFYYQVNTITDPKVILTTTWLDASNAADGKPDSRYWSPAHYLSYLGGLHPLRLPVFGENTGQGSRAAMDYCAGQVARFGLTGMAWYNEDELFSGRYATLSDYRQVITQYNR